MTTSPPTRKISILSLGKNLFIVTNMIGSIVKVLDVVPSIPPRSVSYLANEIFYCAALTFLNCLLIKQTFYLKRFCGVGVTVDKHGRWHVKMGTMEEIIGWEKYWF